MDDLISRQAAIDALAELARDSFTIKDTFQIYLDALKDADLKIRQMPTAEPRKGKWVEVYLEDGILASRCTACGELDTGVPLNYCPWCGARMEN